MSSIELEGGFNYGVGMQVDGSVAVVTGAGGGIGAGIARALVASGAKVVLTDLNEDGVSEVAASLPSDSAVFASGDAGSVEHIDEVVRLAESTFGPVDFYFANAGIGGGPGLQATEEQWDAAFNVNVMAHVRAAKRLVPGWVERGNGYFVSTASAAGLLTQLGSSTYAVTKHAAVGFSEWLSATYGTRGVKVSCLCPMGVDTNLLRPNEPAPAGSNEELMQRAVTSAGRVLTTDEVATAVLDAIADERFLILPHPEVLDMYRHKGTDYDRWLRGMQRYQSTLMS
jgi:NAD(P)-dependent dehydrogenase (short-subunit alcohol dehydrogenase family)